MGPRAFADKPVVLVAVPSSRAGPSPCPECGGTLSEPVSGDVHCYVECMRCGVRFDLKDPRIGVG